jgi:L-Ala-D/L-Glu epimerase
VELTAQIVTLRLAETFVIARESSDEEEVVQVELTHDGVTGYGEGAPIERYDEGGRSALDYLEEAGPLLGADPFALEEIESRLPHGENAARAALDGALHDLQGKLLGIPAWRLLGLPRTGPPTSWTVWLGDPDDMARRAEKAA